MAIFSKKIAFLFLFLFTCQQTVLSQCSNLTPSFTVNLTASPNASYTSPNTTRVDTCCGGVLAGDCVKFTIFLHPQSQGINFGFASGAVPPGALFYQIGCGVTQSVGTAICLNGPGPHILTFCKPGGNANTYSITAIPNPSAPDSVFVRDGCAQVLSTTGFSVPTITWGAINAGTNTAFFNGILSCTAGCATVNVSPTTTVPLAFVDYTVGGFGFSPCISNYYKDTVRVFFYNSLQALFSNTTICFGGTTAVLSPTVIGGKSAYSYTWSTGSNASTISVGPGTYTLTLGDATGCPPITSTVSVTGFSVPITSNPGASATLCATNASVNLSGTVTGVSTGSWSGGTGSFVPSNTVLNTTYVPTAAELLAGMLTLTLTSTNNLGCPPAIASKQITFQQAATVTALPSRTLCANNSTNTYTATVAGYTSTPLWSSSGSGTFNTTTANIITYSLSPADITTGSVLLIASSSPTAACGVASDSIFITITPKPLVSAGPNQTICSTSSAVLSGSVSGGSTSGTWQSSGNGTFVPSASALSATYIPGSSDLSSGSSTLILFSSNNGNCLFESDTLVLSIKQQPTVTIATPSLICANTASIAITASLQGIGASAVWSSSGAGTFQAAAGIATNTYILSAADFSNGFFSLSFSSINNSPCSLAAQTKQTTLQALPIVNAGNNYTVCSTVGTLSLTGNITSAAGTGSWIASGAGTFPLGASQLVTNYSISPSDINSGAVQFTLSSTNDAPCPSGASTVQVTIVKSPTVLPMPSLTVCSTTTLVPISGTVISSNNQVLWTTFGTGAITSATSLSTNYILSAADIANSAVLLNLSSTGNAPCQFAQQSLNIFIKAQPTVQVQSLNPICSGQPSIALSASVSGIYGQLSWATNGTGSITNQTASQSPFFLSALDQSLSNIVFTVTTSNNAPCSSTSNTLSLSIIKAATVTAQSNFSICSSSPSVQLQSSVTGTYGISWSSSGGGVFAPAITNTTPVYFFSANDYQTGSVNFVVTSTGSGPCAASTASTQLSIVQLPVISFLPKDTLCSISSSVNISASINGQSTLVTWATNGTGSFSAIQNSATNYFLSATDKLLSKLIFTLSSIGNSVCPQVNNSFTVPIETAALVNAGSDYSVCSTAINVSLNATLSNVFAPSTWYTPNGTGTISGTGNIILYNFAPGDLLVQPVILCYSVSPTRVCPAASDTARLYITKLPQLKIQKDTTLCLYSLLIPLSGTLSGGSGSVLWTSNGTGSFVPSNSTQATFYQLSQADTKQGSVKFNFISTNNGGCGNVGKLTEVSLLPKPKSAFTVSSATVMIPNNSIQFTNQSVGAKRFTWFFGDGTTDKSPISVDHKYKNAGYFNVSLVAENEFGCLDTSIQQISAYSEIKFPNAFTPNGSAGNGGTYNAADNSNDVFFPFVDGLTEYELRIFNRWGELIFESNDIKIGWDGNFNGKPCQQDTYVYVAKGKFFDSRTFNQTGTVTLLR